MSLRRFSILLIIVFCTGWIVGACGRKGDLYLPDAKPKAAETKPKQTTDKQP